MKGAASLLTACKVKSNECFPVVVIIMVLWPRNFWTTVKMLLAGLSIVHSTTVDVD